jgi:mannose-6-phosphate isomerase-like protein (cupin superfamily)
MVALLNDDVEFRLAKLQGEFVWHSHSTTDELFFILEGGPLNMSIRHQFDDSSSEETITLEKGDMFVVPKGMQHLPFADNEVRVLVVEKKGELNTGDLGVTWVYPDRTSITN